jgi:hypothetical protein
MNEYIFILPCCGKKTGDYAKYGTEKIMFVVNPSIMPETDKEKGVKYVSPDEKVGNVYWADLVKDEKLSNMLPAYKLYSDPAYKKLYYELKDRFYIFSAAWGIVKSKTKLPKYNITFSKNAKKYAITKKPMINWKMLEDLPEETSIVIATGEDYIKPFMDLTENLPNKKIIIHNLSNITKLNRLDFEFIKWKHDKRRTTWYYNITKLLNEQSIKNINVLIKRISKTNT